MRVEIFTPYCQYLEEETSLVSIISDGNSLGILPNHYPLISTLKVSKLRIEIDGKTRSFAIGEGVMNVKNDIVSILTECIEESSEIDLDRAIDKEKEMLEKLEKETDSNLRKAYEKSLKKAQNRIAVYNEANQWFM